MTLGQSQWVGSATDLVLGPRDARLAGAGELATNSSDPLDVRTGVVFSGNQTLVTGRADLKVDVAKLHFVCSKAATNGPYLGVNLTSEAVTVPAAPALGSKRIDVLWVVQQDKTATTGADAVTLPIFGVKQGTAGSSPAKPALTDAPAAPVGAEEIGTITWDSTSVVASTTNAAQCTLATTCRWTTTRGAPIPVRTVAERSALSPYLGMLVLRLDKGGLVQRYDGTTWRGQRTHAQTWTGTLGSGGAINVSHGCDFTPAVVVPNDVNATAGTGAMAFHIGVGSITGTTMQFVCTKYDGTFLPTGTSVTIHGVMYEAET